MKILLITLFMNKHLQGSVEYLLILFIIIIISLIIVSFISGFNLFDFTISNKARTNEISHLMSDVSFGYTIDSHGHVQLKVKPLKFEELNSFKLIIKSGSDYCNITTYNLYFKDWTINQTSCSFLKGEAGHKYLFNCTVEYIDDKGFLRKKKDYCIGVYEAGITGVFSFITSSESDFNEGTYINTTYGSVRLAENKTSGLYISKVFDAGSEAEWQGFNWSQELPYGSDLPDNQGFDDGANMSNNLLLLHLDELSGNLMDGSGNDNNGVNYGATYGVKGIFGKALYFDGNDRVEITESTNLGLTSNFSYGAWFKINSLSNYAGVMSRMRSWPNGYNLQVGTANKIACGWGTYTVSNDLPSIDEWYFAVCVYSDGVMKLYVNGVLQNDMDSGVMNVGDDDLKLGVFYTSNSLYFDGVIDEVFVINRSLSSNEVLNLYKRGVLRLNASIRSCDDPQCNGESWSNGLSVNDNQYFQYRFNFSTSDVNYSPILNNVTIKYKV